MGFSKSLWLLINCLLRFSLSIESCDGLKRTSDAAIQCGYQRRTRELADWARSKKRRTIRREDLLAYLAGRTLPTQSTHANRRWVRQRATSPHPPKLTILSTFFPIHSLCSSSPKPEHHHGGGLHSNHHHQLSGGANGVAGFATNGLSMMPPAVTANGGQPTHLLNAAGGQGAVGGAVGGNGGIVGDDLHTFKEALVLRPR